VSRRTRAKRPAYQGQKSHDSGRTADHTRHVETWSERRLRLLALATFAVVVLLDVGYVLASRGLNGQPGLRNGDRLDVGEVVGIIAPAIVGLLLAWARPRNAIGWLITSAGLTLGLSDLGQAYGERSVAFPDEHLPAGMWALSLSAPLWVWAVFIPPTLLLARYPSGRIAGRWPRRFERTALVAGGVLWIGYATSAQSVSDEVVGRVPPLHLPELVGGPLLLGGGVTLLAMAVAICLDAVRRAVKGSRDERLALLWLLTSTVLMVVLIFFSPWEWVSSVAYFGVLVSLAVGVLRYGALGIDLVIRRTLLYASLTGLVLVVFVGVVAGLARIVPSGPVPELVAAVVIAVGLGPARDRVQGFIDRLLYGERDDPFAALHRLSEPMSLDDGELLPGVLAALAEALHLQGARVAGPGEPGVPLVFAGAELGSLQVNPRRGEASLSKADERLLGSVAPLVAAVVHAVRLADDLRVERTRVLEATQAERTRLRRELHDGLGPSLTGIGLGLEAAQRSGASDALLARLRVEVTSSLEEVRRIIDDLRPSALDHQDLLSALRVRAEQVTSTGALEVDLDAPPHLPELSPSVAAAAYRIADEALTNVVRHSEAKHCRVQLRVADCLQLEVTDDGIGPGSGREGGVGLGSMKERAERLGGLFSLRATYPGTAVAVELPLVVP
jgi:signal transduction histidine kinase